MNHPQIKILVDCHVFDHGFQGTRTYIEGIYREWIQNNDFRFFLASHNPENLQQVFGIRENVTYLSYASESRWRRLLFEIPRLIKQHQIDYTHFQYIVSPLGKGKYIVTTHDVLFLDFPEYFPALNRIKNTFLYKLSAQRSAIRLTVSAYSQQRIAQHFKMSDYRITGNAVSPVFFEPYDKSLIRQKIKERYPLEDYIIYISRWEPRKKHDLILKSFLDMGLYKTHQLVFIGDTTFSNPAYEELYASLPDNVKEKILRIEKTDFQTMITLLRGAKACVYPSIAEGFGIPPLEAVAAQIPTLCSNRTAMSDFDFFGEFFFDPGNIHEFEQKLKRLLESDHSDRFAQMTAQMAQKYNWKKSALVIQEAVLEDYNR